MAPKFKLNPLTGRLDLVGQDGGSGPVTPTDFNNMVLGLPEVQLRNHLGDIWQEITTIVVDNDGNIVTVN